MQKRNFATIILTFFILMTNIGCDQISKRMVRQRVHHEEIITVISYHFILTRTENKGAFLSWGDSLSDPIRFTFLSVVPLIALFSGLAILFMSRKISRFMRLGLCFFIGGGIGNIYDRIIHGSVTDFLHINLGFIQTGIFNMADVSIMIGMLIILTDFFVAKEYLVNDH
jgi:signal peptidase II